jgi:hypothetical protein
MAFTPVLGAIVNYQTPTLVNLPAIVAKTYGDGTADLLVIRPAFDGIMYMKQAASSSITAPGSFSPSTANGSVSVNGTVLP